MRVKCNIAPVKTYEAHKSYCIFKVVKKMPLKIDIDRLNLSRSVRRTSLPAICNRGIRYFTNQNSFINPRPDTLRYALSKLSEKVTK